MSNVLKLLFALTIVSLIGCLPTGSGTHENASDLPSVSPGGSGGDSNVAPLPDLPDTLEKTKVLYTGQMMGREFVASMLREIFGSSTYVVGAEIAAFDTILRSIEEEPTVYGRACNVYSSFSGLDCGDSLITSSSSSMMPVSTIVRQMNKLTACESIVERTALMKAAAEKIPGGLTGANLSVLDRAKIENLYRLFYRAREPRATEIDAINKFSTELKNGGATTENQWRGVLQIICEQPGWEAV